MQVVYLAGDPKKQKEGTGKNVTRKGEKTTQVH